MAGLGLAGNPVFWLVQHLRNAALARDDPDRERHTQPQREYADKVYDPPALRQWLHGKHITSRIARRGVDASDRLGRYRRRIERTFSWLSGYRRLTPRYERDPELYLGFLGLATALSCYKRLHRGTT